MRAPALSQGWATFTGALKGLPGRTRQRFSTFLSSVGLRIVTITGGNEEPKELIVKSWKVALARCGVHILPACVSIILITINIWGYYIGQELQGPRGNDSIKMGVLQVCAKAQELLVVASVATIIFHVIRAELIHGAGLPLGFISSGFAFTQMSFFWSTDFWGALHYDCPSRPRKAGFISLLVICGIIALVAGPATAVLMIPRDMNWAVGGGRYWLNGTKDELWLSTLHGDYLGSHPCSTVDQQLHDPRCPSGGYLSLHEHFSNWRRSLEGMTRFEVQDSNTRKMMYTFSRRPDYSIDTWAVTNHACVATMQDAVHSLWNRAVSYLSQTDPYSRPGARSLHLAYIRTFKVEAEFPAVRTACSNTAVTFSRNASVELEFPTLAEFETRYNYTGNGESWEEYFHVQEVTSTIQTKIDAADKLRIPKNESHLLATPIYIDDPARPGLGLVLLRKVNLTNEIWEARGCTIDARWTPGHSIMNYLSGNLAYDYIVDQGRELLETELFSETWNWGSFNPPKDGSWRRIDVDPSWFDVFAPVLSEPSTLAADPFLTNQTTLESLLNLAALTSYSSSFGDYELYATTMTEHAVSALMVDGLSRIGSQLTANYSAMLEPLVSAGFSRRTAKAMVRLGRPLQNFGVPSIPADHLTPMLMLATVDGYVLVAIGWFDYFCIAVLLLHALFALGHTLWVLWYRETSDAWDTIPELLALAENSPPPEDGDDVLANTCAGVRKFRTMARLAWVEKAENSHGADAALTGAGREELRLRFRSSGCSRRSSDAEASVGTKYGKLSGTMVP